MDKKILFFDDEQGIAVVQKNLELFGYDVKLVSTISEFFAEINKTTVTYDLLLMDIMAPMPSEEEKKRFTDDEIAHMDAGLSTGVVLIDKIRNFSQSDNVSMCSGANVGEVLANKVGGIARYVNIPVLFYSAKSSVKQFPNMKLITKPALAKNIVEEIEALLKGGAK
jgi:CheY-like chemotaxis protein